MQKSYKITFAFVPNNNYNLSQTKIIKGNVRITTYLESLEKPSRIV